MCEDCGCEKEMEFYDFEDEEGMPLIGDELPEFEAQTTHGKMKIPEAFAGRWFVLFSHPADFTPVCTTEFIAFQNKIAEFEELDCGLIGLSIDQIYAHIKWLEWIQQKLGVEITFPVIADNGDIAEMLGLIHPGKGSSTVRAVFIVDPKAKIRAILFYPQELGRNMSEIVRMVRALQTADREKVAMPADWPNNSLVKDHVIIPPPTDIKTAAERMSKYECYDWWLCHKKL